MVPLHVAKMKPAFKLPNGEMSNVCHTMWVHESEMPCLKLQRKPLYQQLPALRQMIVHVGYFIPLQFPLTVAQPFLQFGVRTQMTMFSVRPSDILSLSQTSCSMIFSG